MYQKEEETFPVVWEPDDEQAAIQAMKDVDGTGVPDEYTLPDDAPVRVPRDVADAVRARYDEITTTE